MQKAVFKNASRRRAVIGASIALTLGFAASLWLWLESSSRRNAETLSRLVASEKEVPVLDKFARRLHESERFREVQREVEERNSENERQHAALREDGWEPTESAQPDPDVTELNPDALAAKEPAIQLQLQTGALKAENLENAKRIALAAESRKTRVVAIEAIVRSPDPKAQETLIDIYRATPVAAEKSMVVTSLRPSSPRDSIADFLFEQMADPAVPEKLRRQAAYPVIVSALLEAGAGGQGPQPSEELLARVPAGFQEEFREIYRMTRDGEAGPPH